MKSKCMKTYNKTGKPIFVLRNGRDYIKITNPSKNKIRFAAAV